MQKIWDIDVVGVLADDEYVKEKVGRETVFINRQGAIQFYIRIISQTPESFPNEKLIWCYSTLLEEWGFEDDLTLSKPERIDNLKDFLEGYFIIFGLQRKTTAEGNTICQATNVKLKVKFESYLDNMFFLPIPVFSESTSDSSFEEFKNKLANSKYIGKIKRFSNELSDTPTYILWRHEDGRYTVFGEFDKHHYAHGGFQLFYENLKHEDMPEEWLENVIEVPRNEDVLFVSLDIYNLFQDLLQYAEPMKIISQETVIPVKSNEVSILENSEDENTFINYFYQITQKHGFLYDKKDLINFHTAMKSSNLVILSGMSGIGKSKLVEMYGKAWGMDDQQLKIISVRPSWTDDADLIGYVDSIHMVYRPGDSELINTLVHASKEENYDKLYIICFDEMNLARVEHYFSQFLSVLELEPPRRQLNLYNEELESRLYNSSKYRSSIVLGDNILFVGTVNIDESTYYFSDKVLDRANVITLSNKMSFQALNWSKPKKINLEKKSFTAKDFRDYRKKGDVPFLSTEELQILDEIHYALHSVHNQYGIGFRIVKQIDLYLRNLPDCKELTRRDAFDLQLVQRVLTKLRGPEELLGEIIGNYNKEANTVENSFLLSLFDQYTQVSDFDESKRVVRNKAKELAINGYTG